MVSSEFRPVAAVCALFFLIYLGSSLWLSLFSNYLLRSGMDSVLIGITLMLYNASLSATFLPSGRLSDRLGRRPLILAGSFLLSVCSLSLALWNGTAIMLLAVVGEAVGLGLLAPSSNALVSDLVSGRRSGIVFATYQIATLSAAVVGSFSAGFLADTIGFAGLFVASAGLAGLATVAGYVVVPNPRATESAGYTSALVDSLRSSVTGTARMLRSNSELALLAGALLVHALGFSMISPFISLFAEKGVRLDIAQVGMVVATWNAALAIAQIPSGHLTDRFGARQLLLVHVVLSSASWIIYTWSWNLQSAVATMVFFGIVGALDMPARRTIMIEYATSDTGKATVIGSLDAITGAIGIAGPLIGGLAWQLLGSAAPFQLAGLVNAFACIPLVIMMRRTRQGAGLSRSHRSS